MKPEFQVRCQNLKLLSQNIFLLNPLFCNKSADMAFLALNYKINRPQSDGGFFRSSYFMKTRLESVTLSDFTYVPIQQ